MDFCPFVEDGFDPFDLLVAKSCVGIASPLVTFPVFLAYLKRRYSVFEVAYIVRNAPKCQFALLYAVSETMLAVPMTTNAAMG